VAEPKDISSSEMTGDGEWLVSLLAACDRGLARLRAVEAPPVDLIRDLKGLHSDLAARLDALETPEERLRRLTLG
jgi:hypothetical protein